MIESRCGIQIKFKINRELKMTESQPNWRNPIWLAAFLVIKIQFLGLHIRNFISLGHLRNDVTKIFK